MLLIKSDPNGLKGVEQFLKNREWHLKSTHTLKEAILYIVQNKPSFVLISVDHPDRKIHKLPKIIAAAFPCCVMAYAEKSMTASFKSLMDFASEYKINPPVTGPAIERAVNKFIRDQEQALRQKDNAGAPLGSDPNSFEFRVEVKSDSQKQGGFLTVSATSGVSGESGADGSRLRDTGESKGPGLLRASGGAMQAEGDAVSMSTDQQDFAKNLLAQLGGLDGEDEAQDSEGRDGNLIVLPPNARRKGDLILPSAQGKSTPGSISGSLGQQGSAGPQTAGQDGSSGGPLILGQGRKRPHAPGGASGAEAGDGNDLGSPEDLQARSAAILGGFPASGETLDPSRPPGVVGRSGLPSGGVSPEEDLDPAARELYVPTGSNSTPQRRLQPGENLRLRENSSLTEDSIFVKGVVKSVDETVDKIPDEIQERLEDSTQLACIVVESAKFSGYLVAALGKDRQVDDEFLSLVQSRLVSFLRDHGESVGTDHNLQLKVKSVDFEAWSLSQAEFLKKSLHKGTEVAMAFFPVENARTKVGESVADDMVSVQTHEIQTDVPLEFNLYVYLPTNKKFVLYTPERGTLLHEQRDRLVQNGVHSLHIRKNDVQNLSKFRAQNHLNGLIDEFERPTVAKKKAS